MGVLPVLLQTAHTHLCLLTFIIQIMQRSETCLMFFWFLFIRETGLFCLCGDNICVSVYSVKTSVQSERMCFSTILLIHCLVYPTFTGCLDHQHSTESLSQRPRPSGVPEAPRSLWQFFKVIWSSGSFSCIRWYVSCNLKWRSAPNLSVLQAQHSHWIVPD